MAENLFIASGGKQEKYEALLPQLRALFDGENDIVANTANCAAALHATFGHLWTGFYFVKDATADEDGNADKHEKTLVLGPFQGPIACTRIACGRGVCGTAWKEGRTLIVPDVNEFPGHIACSSQSRSEIVVPVFRKTAGDSEIIGVLDIDSAFIGAFDGTDRKYLEEICLLLSRTI